MTFTYDVSTLTSNPIHEVRFLLRDTVDEGHYLEDEEIQYALTTWMDLYGSTLWVASVLAENIAAAYAAEASYSADGVSVSLGPVGDQFRALAASLRQQHQAKGIGGAPIAGGVEKGDRRNPDVKNFAFGTGMHDYLDAGPQDYGDVDEIRYGYNDDIGTEPTEP